MSDDAFIKRLRLLSFRAGNLVGLAEKAGVSNSTVHLWLKGSEPSREKIVALADAMNVSVEWLATGRGEMSAQGHPEGYRILNAQPNTGQPEKPVAKIRGVNHIAFNEEWLASLPGAADPASLVLTQANGDAMVPTIQGGDLVLINFADGRRTLRDGLYAILWLGREPSFVIRRLRQRLDGGFDVICDNPAYSPEDRFAQGFHPESTMPEPDVMFARLIWFGRTLLN